MHSLLGHITGDAGYGEVGVRGRKRQHPSGVNNTKLKGVLLSFWATNAEMEITLVPVASSWGLHLRGSLISAARQQPVVEVRVVLVSQLHGVLCRCFNLTSQVLCSSVSTYSFMINMPPVTYIPANWLKLSLHCIKRHIVPTESV